MAADVKTTTLKNALRICAAPRASLNKRLIAEVRKRPGLWRRGDTRMDRGQTQQAWFEIGAILNGVNPDAARKRWKNLKDVFTRKYYALQRRRAADTDKQSGIITERWQYFKDLLFLRHSLRDVLETSTHQFDDNVVADHDYAGPSIGLAAVADGSSSTPPHAFSSSSETDSKEPSIPREMTNGLEIGLDAAENALEPAAISDDGEDNTTTILMHVASTTEVEDSSVSPSNEIRCTQKRRSGLVVSEVRSIAEVSSSPRGHALPSASELRTAEASSQSSQQKSTAHGPFNGTMEVRSAPIHMDHITHFLFSLDSYIRKTSEELQPQLQMELLNVASSYSQNVFPQLLFPRT